MAEDGLRYDKMVEEALRGVVREALEQTARDGLFGDHHFYITFHTRAPGVALADHIRVRHPDEMTIVLQHQFWGLEVDDEKFAVTLSFSGVSERLVIPFAAVTGFADPSAKFGLQFQVEGEEYDDEEGEDDEIEVSFVPDPGVLDEPDNQPERPAPSGDGKVVALDAFRKK
ncbi:MAG: SspB family protein [Solirubrobacterales bacterium]